MFLILCGKMCNSMREENTKSSIVVLHVIIFTHIYIYVHICTNLIGLALFKSFINTYEKLWNSLTLFSMLALNNLLKYTRSKILMPKLQSKN
jgi:hypothetical protein